MSATDSLPKGGAHTNGTMKDAPITPNGSIATKPTSKPQHAAPNGIKAPNASTSDSISTPPIPATALLASFISSATPALLTPALRHKLKEVLLDYIGVVAAGAATAPSSEPILSAMLALGATEAAHASATVLTHGRRFTAPSAALLNATFGHSLDFDDTYAAGTLHAGVTVISAALAQVESSEGSRSWSSDEFLTAVAVGYEVTCRLGRELGFEAYARGFHNTGTAGIFGAVAAACVLRGAGARTVEMACGLAGSKAAGSMQYLANGSWNKRLHPGFAAQDAFLCVALAEAGVLGAEGSIEGKHGFLQAYSPATADLERLVAGLGREWVWMQTSLKPFPACRMTHSFIEMAGAMGMTPSGAETGKGVKKDDVKRITLRLSTANMILVGEPNRNKIHPENVVDAQFSAYFQTANAWIYGAGFDVSAYTRLEDREIRKLCGKIECVVDDAFAGVMGGALRVEWVDGTTEERELRDPLGEPGRPFKKEQVESKFLGLMSPVYGEERSREVMEMVYGIDGPQGDVKKLLALLQ